MHVTFCTFSTLHLVNVPLIQKYTNLKIYSFFFNPCLLFSFPEICYSDVLVEKDDKLARSHVEVRLQTASLSVGQFLQEG